MINDRSQIRFVHCDIDVLRWLVHVIVECFSTVSETAPPELIMLDEFANS